MFENLKIRFVVAIFHRCYFYVIRNRIILKLYKQIQNDLVCVLTNIKYHVQDIRYRDNCRGLAQSIWFFEAAIELRRRM